MARRKIEITASREPGVGELVGEGMGGAMWHGSEAARSSIVRDSDRGHALVEMWSRSFYRCCGLTLPLAVALLALGGCAASRTGHRPAAGGGGQALRPSLSDTAFVSRDGASFPVTRWGSKSPPETVIVAVHGLSGAASDFNSLGENFVGRSTAVYSYELRGQGKDPVRRRVGDIRSPHLWFADFDTFLGLVRAANPRARLFVYGESLGGLIAIHAMDELSPENRDAICGIILSSPVVSLKDRKHIPRLRYAAMQMAVRVLPRRRISLETLAAGKQDMTIAGGTNHLENLRRTPHAVDEFTFRLLGTMERLIDSSLEHAARIDKPILVLYPAKDLLTTAEDVEAWFAALQTRDKEKQLFAESYHLLLHDKQRAEVLERVRVWLERH